jgi:hypothetical protein
VTTEAAADPGAAARSRLAAVLLLAAFGVCAAGAGGWMAVDRADDGAGSGPPAAIAAAPTGPSSPTMGRPTAIASLAPSPTGQPAGTPSAATLGGHSSRSTPSTSAPSGSTSPIGDGKYVAGADIAAGKWVTAGALHLGLVCRYTVNGAAPKVLQVGQVSVRLVAGDRFSTSGCAPWHFTG